MKLKTLSYVLGTAMMLVAPMANASADLFNLYESKLIDRSTGIYAEQEWLFFVVKQDCLSEKRYAGTQESKAAERKFYELFAKEVSKRNVSFSEQMPNVGQPLSSDIARIIAQKYDASRGIRHQLLFDRNSKNDALCQQEYVVAAKLDQFKPQGITIPAKEVYSEGVNLISDAVEQEDYPRLIAYLESIELNQLANIYRIDEEITPIYFNLRVNDSSANSDWSLADKAYSQFDINHVLSTVLKHEGYVKLENRHSAKELSLTLFNQASVNFRQGKNAQAIIADLTLSLNLNPNNPAAWKMLSDIFRAVGAEQEARVAAVQYVMYSPQNMEAWVHMFVTHKQLDPTLSMTLSKWLKAINHKVPFSPWAKTQLGIK